MKTTDKLTRQQLGCGYETPLEHADPWDHDGREPAGDEFDDDGHVRLPICPGYVCGLPEVREIAIARQFWDKGELAQFCDGAQATPMLRDGIAILEGEAGCSQLWAMKNPEPR
jgi:hypothetical protein